MKTRNATIFVMIFCAVLMLAETASAVPHRWYPRRRVVKPVVVTTKPRVVVTSPAKTTKVAEGWGSQAITQEPISPEIIKERGIKPDQGLIDFEVYPTSTKIYLDGSYKGTAGTLNKEKHSLKATAGRHTIELKKKLAPTKIVRIRVEARHKTRLEQY